MADSRRPQSPAMKASGSFRDFVLDQLAGVNDVRARAMFGGVGLYSGEFFFGLIADTLYLRVDDSNREQYTRAGSQPFRPYADRPTTMSYFAVPAGVLDDVDVLTGWANQSVAVARTSPPRKAPRPRVSRRSTVTRSNGRGPRRQ